MQMAGSLGALWIVSGAPDEGQRWLEKAVAHGSTASEAVRARALTTLSWIRDGRGLEGALPLAEEGLVVSRSAGEPLLTCFCLLFAGLVANANGHYDQAVARFEEGMTTLPPSGASDLRSHHAVVRNMRLAFAASLGTAALRHGSIATAEEWYRLALAQQLESGCALGQSHLYGFVVPLGLGDLARARGDPSAALGYYRETLRLGSRHHNVQAICMGLGGVACSLAALSRHEPAARLFGACEALSVATGVLVELEGFDPQRLPGWPEARALDHDLGATYQDICRTLAGNHPLPPIRDLASITGHWEEGRRLSLEQAVAEALAVQLDALPSPDSSHPLSPREVEVLRLLAEGATNRQIAERLSISERTVDHHVLHILTKLGLESRTAAAVWAVRNEAVLLAPS